MTKLQIYFGKNNLTPQLLMRCTQDSLLQSRNIVFVSWFITNRAFCYSAMFELCQKSCVHLPFPSWQASQVLLHFQGVWNNCRLGCGGKLGHLRLPGRRLLWKSKSSWHTSSSSIRFVVIEHSFSNLTFKKKYKLKTYLYPQK